MSHYGVGTSSAAVPPPSVLNNIYRKQKGENGVDRRGRMIGGEQTERGSEGRRRRMV